MSNDFCFCLHSCDSKFSVFDHFPCILECCFSFSLLSRACVWGGGEVGSLEQIFFTCGFECACADNSLRKEEFRRVCDLPIHFGSKACGLVF